MSCPELILNPDNSFSIRFVLTNPELNPIYVNDATVDVTISDTRGTPIVATPITWPDNLPYVTASNGEYEKTFDPISTILDGKTYQIKIDATGNGGEPSGSWTNNVIARTRRA